MRLAKILGLLLMVPGVSCSQTPKAKLTPPVRKIVEAARSQIKVTTLYDPSYVSISYPKGDVELKRGVCSDVVIRALRAVGVDLQVLIHEDMRKNFSLYPNLWGLKKPDSNIDHRRVPNMAQFFERAGKKLRLGSRPGDFLPGDIVVTRLPGGLIHVMLVSDRLSVWGVPLVIHNIGNGVQEENALFSFANEGQYRWVDP
jgi:uncharacterized protein